MSGILSHVCILYKWLCFCVLYITEYSIFLSSPRCPVQFSRSVVSDSATPWIAAHQASLSITNSQNLLKLMSIESVMPSNHLILCHPFSSHLQSFPASGSFPSSQFFTSGGQSWSFSFSISPSNEYWGLISFRMNGSPCCPRDSQKTSPTPQFESINFLALSLPYGPTVTSIHD